MEKEYIVLIFDISPLKFGIPPINFQYFDRDNELKG